MSNGHDQRDPRDLAYQAIADDIRAQQPQAFKRQSWLLPYIEALQGLAFGGPMARFAQAQRVTPRESGLDMTDPAVDPGTDELTPDEQIVRGMRRIASTMKSSLMTPLGLGGIEQQKIEGQLAPPRSKAEAVIDFAAPLLASFIQLGPLGMTAAGTAALGETAASRLTAEAAITRMFGPSLEHLAGAAGKKLVAAEAGARIVPRLTAKQLAEGVAGIGTDVAIGTAFGLGLPEARRELGEEVLPEDYRNSVIANVIFAGGIGTMLRLRTVGNTARAVTSLLRTSEGDVLPIAPGTQVKNMVAVQTASGIKYRYAAGTKVDGESVGGRWVPGEKYPKTDDLRDYLRSTVDKYREVAGMEPGGPTAIKAVETASPDTPSTIPEDLRANAPAINTVGAMWYRDRGVHLVREYAPEQVRAEIQNLRNLIYDRTVPVGERETAAARVLALKHALGEAERHPGLLPLDLEATAADYVRRVSSKVGSRFTEFEAAKLRAKGYPELADRIGALLKELPKGYHEEITARLSKLSEASNRGFERGSQVLYQGQLARIVDRPRYGVATISSVGPSAKSPVVIGVEKLIAAPKPKGYAKLQDGTVVRVKAVDESKGQFIANAPKGPERWYKFEDVATVGDSRSAAMKAEADWQQVESFLKTGDMQPVPPIKAATPDGEAVTVIRAGSEGYAVRTKKGRVKNVPRAEVVATEPAAPKEIVAFAPGKLPAPGNKMLFALVPEGHEPVFEELYRSGKTGPGNTMLHVVPPEPGEGTLYAVELSRDVAPLKHYSAGAKEALRALEGKSRFEFYNSDVTLPAAVLDHAQVYHVPESLWRSSHRPVEVVRKMSQDEQTAYLRNLINLNETVDSPVVQAAAESRRARQRAGDALAAGDGQRYAKADAEVAAANAKTFHAEVEARLADADISVPEMLSEVAAYDKNAPARMKVQKEGITDETRAVVYDALDRLPAITSPRWNAPVPSGEERMVWRGAEGSKMYVERRVRPSSVRQPDGTVKPVRERFLQATFTDADGRFIPEIAKDFTDAREAVAYAIEKGFRPTLEKQWLTGEVLVNEQNPSITARITGTKEKPAEVTIKTAPDLEEIARNVEAAELHRYYVQLGMAEGDLYSPTMSHHEIGVLEFDSQAAARQWLEQRGFRGKPSGDQDAFKAFYDLPGIDKLRDADRNQLAFVEDTLHESALASLRLTNHIPEGMKQYAEQLAELYEKAFGHAPFDRDLRIAMEIPTVYDTYSMQVNDTAFYPFMVNPEGRLTLFFRKILGMKRPIIPEVRAAEELAQKTANQRGLVEMYAKAEVINPEPVRLGTPDINVGRYVPTGQAVQIVGVDLPGGYVHIRFPGTGEEFTTVVGNVAQASEFEQGLLGPSWQVRDDLETGRWLEFFRQDPRAGEGAMEQRLGVAGAPRDAIREKFAERAQELVDGILYDKKAGKLLADDETLSELMELYRRAQWLDAFPPESRTQLGTQNVLFDTFKHKEIETPFGLQEQLVKAPGAGVVPVVKQPSPDMGDLVPYFLRKKFGPEVEKAFKEEAKYRTRQALGDHPYAKLMARAFANDLSAEETQVLRDFAKDTGIGVNAPPAAIVVELMERRYLDPRYEQIALRIKDERGFGNWLRGAGIAPDAPVEIRIPRAQDIFSTFNLNVPWKLARRHPLADLALSLLYRAQDSELRFQKRFREFIISLEHGPERYSTDDYTHIRKLLQTHETWAQAVEAGADTRFQFGFNKFRDFFEDSRKHLIRHFLRRRIQPVPFDPANTEHQELLAQLRASSGKDIEIAKGALIMPRNPDFTRLKKGALSFNGETRSNWTEDQIEEFLELLGRYDSAADLPADIGEQARDVFDFWKQWGRDNYWPLIHEGRFAVMAEREGKDVILAWSQNAHEAILSVRELRKQGLLGAAEKARVEDLGIGEVYDDIIVQETPTHEWRGVLNALAEQTKLDPDEVQVLIVRTDRPDLYGVKPGQVHAKPRVRNLQPLIVDPMRELRVYNARLARMEYRWQGLNALRVLLDEQLDGTLSAARSTPRLNGRDGLPRLKEYMLDKFAKAMGEQGKAEVFTDHAVQLMDYIGDLPAQLRDQWFRGETRLPLEAYYRKYAARAASNKYVKWQSLIRLGGIPFFSGSAFANMTQYAVTTMPKLIESGMSAGDAYNIMLRSWKDGAVMWGKSQLGKELTSEMKVMSGILDDAGLRLQPSKHLAGTGLSWGDVVEGPPLSAGSQSKLELAGQWTNYLGMLGFNGAERTNRFSTGIAAIRQTMRKYGLKSAEELTEPMRLEAAESARELVRTTQFLYDEISLPSALAAFGPAGRLLFQFKPFVINMLSYESELMKRVVSGEANAVRQFIAHFGALGLAGGLVGLSYHPVLTAANGIMSTLTGHNIPFVGEDLSAKQRQARRVMATPEENMMNSMHGKWDDLLYYGLPGLLGLSMGQRVGVSGQDLLLSTKDAAGVLGPHFSIYWDMFQAARKYASGEAAGPGTAGLILGAALPSLAPRYLRGAPESLGQDISKILRTPYVARAVSAAVGSSVFSSAFGGRGFVDFLRNNPEGRRLATRDVPTIARNIKYTIDLAAKGVRRDIEGRPMFVPKAGSSILFGGNRFHEELSTLVGLGSIRNEEYSAYIGFKTSLGLRQAAAREDYANRMARAWADANYEEYYEAAAEAMELGIDVPSESVERELKSLTEERLHTIQDRMSKDVRYREP